MRLTRRRPPRPIRRVTLAADRELPQLPEVVAPWPGQRIRWDGMASYVRQTPPTRPGLPPARYVHGLGGSSTNWTDLATLLRGHVAGSALDLPGAGYSDPADHYTLDASAERVIGWIERDRVGPVHLIGNSLGGTVAVKVAAARPDLVRTLTLISPALPFLNPCHSLQSRALPLLAMPGGAEVARRLLHGTTPEQMARQVIEACFADPDRVPPQRFAEAVREIELRYRLEHYVPAYLQTLRSLVTSFLRSYLPGQGSLWRAAAAVRAPTLVIGGRQDRMVDPRVAPRAAQRIPDSRLLILHDAGHLAQLEAPRLVARAIIGFLDEVSIGRQSVQEGPHIR